MNPLARDMMKSLAVIAALVFIANNHSHAAVDNNYERSLARGSVEDVTPQQKYNTAIREAGGAYKENLRDCAQTATDVKACNREAKSTYDRDMADARRILGGGNANLAQRIY